MHIPNFNMLSLIVISIDSYTTTPDIEIQRTLEQVLWKEDGQLEQLKSIIKVGS
ncbi:MAG: hypothetical protein AAFO82_20925 [Bacteroidota bacterium]